MHSPRFPARTKELKNVFEKGRLIFAWKKKVRISMRDQFLSDPIEHFDFDLNFNQRCEDLEREVLIGEYEPRPVRRILSEKSKGLCRQLVIATVEDAIVLQCLSDSLYADIKGKAPSKKSFFEPEDHSFSNKPQNQFSASPYGSFNAWLEFQKSILKFSKECDYVVVTDIANYYDFISYDHLRNIIASHIEIRESILDMLIFVLSGYLWQPDYMPRSEIGLPQMNLDAPRLLAHCFLYELDDYLDNEQKVEFARYMDDIDIGVDSIDQGRRLLRDIDLILQARHVRLNSGKTQILTKSDAMRYYMVVENALLDKLAARIQNKKVAQLPYEKEKKAIGLAIRRGLRTKRFDHGYGEKILKRLLTIAKRVGAPIDGNSIRDIVNRRPSVRQAAFGWTEHQPLGDATFRLIGDYLSGPKAVDEVSIVVGVNALVAAHATDSFEVFIQSATLGGQLAKGSFFQLYAAIWLASKYWHAESLFALLAASKADWKDDYWLGRLVGGMHPIFLNTTQINAFEDLVYLSGNHDALSVMKFHQRLSTDVTAEVVLRKYVRATNHTRPLKITHSKFLVMLSILANPHLKAVVRQDYLKRHAVALRDPFYAALVSRVLPSPPAKANAGASAIAA